MSNIYRGGVTPGQGNTVRGNADEIDIEDSGNIIDATEVEGALQELATELNTEEAALASHIANISDSHDASAISNVAAGNIVATDVQAAIDELDGQDTTIQTDLNYLSIATVTAMKLLSPSVGETLITQENSTGNGGGATYLVVSPQAFDGYGDHELANGNIAVLQNGGELNLLQYGAKGDDSTDDILPIQAAIDYGFENFLPVHAPNRTYKITKPIVVYGYDTISGTGQTGTVIKGGGRESTIFKKYGSANSGSGFSYDSNSVMIATNEDGFNAIESDNRARGITLTGFKLVGNSDDVENGLHCPVKFSNNIVDNVNISSYTESAVWLNANNWLNKFSNMRIWSFNGVTVGHYGINQESGTVTATIFESVYVLSTDTAAFNLKGSYCSARALAADSCTGTIYDLTGYRGVIDAPGAESVEAETNFLIGQLTDVTVINPHTLGNFTSNTATQINFTAGGRARFIRGELGKDYTLTDQELPGYLIKGEATGGVVTLDDVESPRYALNTSTTTAICLSNNHTKIATRQGTHLPYMGYDRGAGSFYLDSKSANPLYLGKAFFMDSQDNVWTDKAAVSHATTARTNIGDIFLANSPRSIGGLGWVTDADGSAIHTTLGTITSAPGSTVAMTDITLDSFATDGQTLRTGDRIANTSGGTANVGTVSAATNTFTIGSKVGTWVAGDYVWVKVVTQMQRGTYTKIPIIHDGETVNRPTTGRVVGQPFFDTTLGIPIWWKGAVWVDATGGTV